jgi:hypothetical protein
MQKILCTSTCNISPKEEKDNKYYTTGILILDKFRVIYEKSSWVQTCSLMSGAIWK